MPQQPALRPFDLLVLDLVSKHPIHGYQILKQLQPLQVSPLNPSSVYYCLRKLEGLTLLESCWQKDTKVPSRQIYAITHLGREYLGTELPGYLQLLRQQSEQLLTNYLGRRRFLQQFGA